MAASLDVGRFVLQHPGIFYGATSLPLAAAALSPVPAPLPLIALVGMLRLASHQVIHRHGAAQKFVLVMLGVTLGASSQHIAPAMSATSSGSTSVLSLFILSLISTVIAFIPLGAEAYCSNRIGGPYTRALLFPALWATVWAGASISPVGRLFAWSPVAHELGPYQWLAPYAGPWGVDWIVGAGAIMFSDVAGRMIIGAMPDSEEDLVEEATAVRRPDVPNLIAFEDEEVLSGLNEGPGCAGPPPARVRSSLSSRHPLWMISFLLLTAALPSYFIDTAPLSITSENNLAITIGCVLPGPVSGGHPPQFDHFVNQSKTLVNAKILIWPEGAVEFTSAADRKAKLAQIQSDVLGQKQTGFVGVSFEESIPLDGSNGQRYKTQNGFLLLGYHGVVHEYYKRNLVPIAESFKMVASNNPPVISTIPYPSRRVRRGKKQTWVYEDLAITSSICMDFASASPFAALDESPSLILAPARTWHRDAGTAMWAHAQARTAELGAPALLWCDGGEGGFSGVAGASTGAHGRLMRAGQGSWETEVAIPRPAHSRSRTLYARRGTWGAFGFVWALVGVGAVFDGASTMGLLSGGNGGVRLLAWIKERRHAVTQRSQGEQTPLLSANV